MPFFIKSDVQSPHTAMLACNRHDKNSAKYECTILWYAVSRYAMLHYYTMPSYAMLYHAIRYRTVPRHTIPCHTIPYPTVAYHTTPYGTRLDLLCYTVRYYTIVARIATHSTTEYNTVLHDVV